MARPRPARRFVPAVAALEDRVTPAAHTWNGGGATANWSDSNNWAEGAAPAVGESQVVIVFNTAVALAVQDIADLVVDTVRFDAGAAVTVRLDADLTLNGLGATPAVLDQTGRNEITGAADLVLASGPAVVETDAPGGRLAVSADVTGPQGLFKTGAGTLELTTTDANTYAGPTTVADGTLVVSSVTLDQGVSGTVVVGDGAGGAGTAVLRLVTDLEVPNAAAVTVNGDGLIDLTAGAEDITTLTLNGGQVGIAGGSVLRLLGGGAVHSGPSAATGQVTGFGTLELAGPTVFTVADGPAARDLSVEVVVADAGVNAALIKDGDGRMALSADNSYGPTTINAGILEINGIQPGFPVTVSGGTLAGGGSVGAVTVGGGTVAPGLADTTGAGVRLRTEGVSFGGGTFAVRLFGLGDPPSDQLVVTGLVDVSGAMLVALRRAADIRPDFIFRLIANDGTDPVSGTFTGLPEGSTFTLDGQPFRISYQGGDGNDVTLMALAAAPPMDRPPVARNDAATTAANTPVAVAVLANDFDPDGDALAVTVTGPPANGAVGVNPDGSITYTPNFGFFGTDRFEYGISDGRGGAASATVTVTVMSPPNRPPVARNDAATTAANTPVAVAVLANDFDPDGDALAVTVTGPPANGSAVVGGNGSITYTPRAGFTGTDTVTYAVDDGRGGTATASVTITVTPPPNRPPVAGGDAATTAANTAVAINVLANDFDPDGDALAVTVTAGPAHGTATVNASGTATYTPAAGFTGTDTFTYQITDGRGGTATASVTITVTPPPNRPPVAADDTAATMAGTPVTVNVLANDGDPDGDRVTVRLAGGPSNGSAVVNADGTITYTPAAGFFGTDSVIYTVDDGRGGTAEARATFTVRRPAARPGEAFAVGSDRGGDGSARLLNADQSVRFTTVPFARSPATGVRVAAGDFDGDGVADLVVGTGPGVVTQVRVISGRTQQNLFAVQPFEDRFDGGVYVAAGDINGDGIADLVITPDEGGGPRVRIFSGVGFGQMADFFGIEDTAFRGGARAAVADLTGDGTGDLLVAAGFGGGPRVAAFNGTSLGSATPVKLFGDFLAFEAALRNGVFITGGDLNGDGFAELITGGGPGGGPRVRAFDGRSLVLNNTQVDAANFFAGNSDNRGGVRVATKDLDADGRADILTGAGPTGGSQVTAYRGSTAEANGTPQELFDFDAQPGFSGGVFVG